METLKSGCDKWKLSLRRRTRNSRGLWLLPSSWLDPAHTLFLTPLFNSGTAEGEDE